MFRCDHMLQIRHEHVFNAKDTIGYAVSSNVYLDSVYIMKNKRPSTLNQAQLNTVPGSGAVFAMAEVGAAVSSYKTLAMPRQWQSSGKAFEKIYQDAIYILRIGGTSCGCRCFLR
jgi:hypothetical protein